jgi:hypothetical protein
VTASTWLATDSSWAANPLPNFAIVRQVVDRQLAKRPDYRAGDIISKGDVKPIFDQLSKRGWKVADQKEILEKVLADNHFLVKQLRTREGRRFMRQLSSDASVYDRLDRVSRHKRGPDTIRRVIRLPNGATFAKANPGRGNPSLSDLVLVYDRGSANRRQLKDYGKSTGFIYTGSALIKRLQQSYQKASRSSS